MYTVWLIMVILMLNDPLGALPIYRMALRRSGSYFMAHALVLIYLLYPTAQTSVLFDFHGDTLAMPLLLFALDALDQRAWTRYGLFVVLALGCKVYVAAPVAVLGLLVWRNSRAPRQALLTTGGALGYGALAFLVIRPLFATAQTSEVHRGLNYLTFYFGRFAELLAS